MNDYHAFNKGTVVTMGQVDALVKAGDEFRTELILVLDAYNSAFKHLVAAMERIHETGE